MSEQKLSERAPPQGALRSLEEDPASRKRFLKMVGGTGAASAFSILVAACGEQGGGGQAPPAPAKPASETSMFGEGDMGILNYALTLEFLETEFYEKAADSGKLSGEALELVKKIGENEREHLETLRSTIKELGGRPAKKPRTKFPLQSQDQILKLAAEVENLGAAAYLGQADKIESKALLAAALTIHSVEGRQAGALNELIGQKPAPEAFAKPKKAAEVLEAVKPFMRD